jgi:formylglycine-generating enzyme required for sulfatase activity
MSGNVWEWMENEYSAGKRALRGGSWDGRPPIVRAAFRHYGDQSGRGDYLGFRLARTLP